MVGFRKGNWKSASASGGCSHSYRSDLWFGSAASLCLSSRALLISNPPHLWGQEIDSGPLRIKVMAWPCKTCTVQAGEGMGRHSCAPAPSQEVSACAVKCYPNSLPPLSASALLPIIWLPFSELLLRLQDVNQWDVVQVDSGTQVRMVGKESVHGSCGNTPETAVSPGVPRGTGPGVAVAAPSAAAQHPGKLPKTHIISDERQIKRGK